MTPRLSARSALSPDPSPEAGALAQALDALRAEGAPLVDLAEGNPTRVGLSSTAGATAALADARGEVYAPASLGLASAREAVAASYAARGASIDPARVVLAASTSELYGWLFKLLCEPGDEVLVPRPSYPLLDWLAALEGVSLASYPTHRAEGFRVEPEDVRSRIRERTRAVVLVHPNNPTGRFVREDDAARLIEVCAERGVALVVDEVFADWPSAEVDARRRRTFAGEEGAAVFVLSGLSKVLCLPQLKLGWMVVGGPAPFAERALGRLELIADTYLSVGTPVQVALPSLLARAPAIREELGARLAGNLAQLDRALAALGPDAPVRRLPLEGGWYAMLEVPRTRSDEDWVLHLAREAGAIVQPGWFFDAEEAGLLVLSLLPEPARFGPAIERVVRALAAG